MAFEKDPAQVFYEDVQTGDSLPTLAVTIDERQLFFFSAATYNGHRIHYDKDWARDVEGYDDVIVQGPLQAALLARAHHRLDRRSRPAGRVQRCRTGRSRSPAKN